MCLYETHTQRRCYRNEAKQINEIKIYDTGVRIEYERERGVVCIGVLLSKELLRFHSDQRPVVDRGGVYL